MNNEIIESLEKKLGISKRQVETVIKLLSDGNTIPFIARYRKEATGALDEEKIRSIEETYKKEENLYNRKLDVIRLIDEKGMLTDELQKDIMNCTKLVEVEDIYLPYKEKKKTKASEAIKNGLQGLADFIMTFNGSPTSEASKYLNDVVKSCEDAITGAKYIIAENISDTGKYRKYIRESVKNYGTIVTKVKKNNPDTNGVYEIYYDFSEKIKYIKPYRVLAINRAEKEKVINVSIDYDEDYIINYLEKNVNKNKNSESGILVSESIKDSLNRLIIPSVTREIRNELTEIANVSAIKNFSENLEHLLLTPPIKERVVLALDPGYRTGTKVAVVGKVGEVLDITVIYPAPPHNKIEESEKIILDLINKHKVDIIAIGNGTASRENEEFVANLLKKCDRHVEYIIVNEAGASVYSASLLGAKEFPNLTVEKRSAISLARRLQDSLSELVKIDPQSIGVGLYQHDVPSRELSESLNFTVSKIVNLVGVNVNNASSSILSYVSGLKRNVIENILKYKEEVGKIKNRAELKKIKGMSDKVYEQSIGFLRIVDGDNPLDKTDIHPDNYQDAINLLESIGMSLNDIGSKELIDKLSNIDKEYYKKLNLDKYTFEDIVKSLEKPNRDPRDKLEKPILRSDILTIDNLKLHDKLQGTVRNVIDFGAFVDIGLHNDGLVHISKMSKNFIKHPSEVLQVGDIIDVYVIDINKEKEKVSLSLFLE
ncbi:MAG: RNA-binding transcriptional accessory protein [Bacilli bacterium]|nr:RNA-binding transcriptional accessory protein [Bacilli bacterium]